MKFLRSVSTSPPLSCSILAGNNVPDLDLEQTGLAVLVHVDVDGEMCVDVSHLVPEALCDTNDQVVDERSDGPEGCDILSGAMVEFDVDDILLGVGEVDCQVAQVLGEFACASPSELRLPLPSAISTYLGDPRL
jgi:hypothetical protein